ncbi:MAG: metalloregulator ArsR/SmtB family transcription factor [Armatimonas sp.]
MSIERIRFKAVLFQALAHPTRIAILELLRNGELSAGALAEGLALKQVNVSQHLHILRTSGLVASRRDSRHFFYRVSHRELFQILDVLKQYAYDLLKESSDLMEELRSEHDTMGS